MPVGSTSVHYGILTPCSSTFMSCSAVLAPAVASFRQDWFRSGRRNSRTSLGGSPRVLLRRDDDGITSSNTDPRNVCSWWEIHKAVLTHCNTQTPQTPQRHKHQHMQHKQGSQPQQYVKLLCTCISSASLLQGIQGIVIGTGSIQNYIVIYSSPPLIRPAQPVCQENVATLERWALVRGRNNAFIQAAAKNCGHIREGGLCWEWPLREGLLYPHTATIARVCSNLAGRLVSCKPLDSFFTPSDWTRHEQWRMPHPSENGKKLKPSMVFRLAVTMTSILTTPTFLPHAQTTEHSREYTTPATCLL